MCIRVSRADGTYYRGYCYHNRGYGYGEMRYSNNDIYRGYFKYGGVREGQGLFQNQYGTYDGYFMNDLPHTPPDHYGKMTYRNNAVYEGQWAEGKRHGYGKYAYYHGDSYEGEWLDDVAVGVGVVTFADGSKFEGDFGRSFKFGNKAIHKW